MDELTRCQLVIEAMLQLKAQIKMGEEVEELFEIVLEITRGFQDNQAYELLQEANNQKTNRTASVHCIDEAIAHLHQRIDSLLKKNQ